MKRPILGDEAWRQVKLTEDVVKIDILHEHPLQYTSLFAKPDEAFDYEMKDIAK